MKTLNLRPRCNLSEEFSILPRRRRNFWVELIIDRKKVPSWDSRLNYEQNNNFNILEQTKPIAMGAWIGEENVNKQEGKS